VQVETSSTRVESARFQLLNLKYEAAARGPGRKPGASSYTRSVSLPSISLSTSQQLSSFAFNFNLHRYIKDSLLEHLKDAHILQATPTPKAGREPVVVGGGGGGGGVARRAARSSCACVIRPDTHFAFYWAVWMVRPAVTFTFTSCFHLPPNKWSDGGERMRVSFVVATHSSQAVTFTLHGVQGKSLVRPHTHRRKRPSLSLTITLCASQSARQHSSMWATENSIPLCAGANLIARFS